jgi:hypothetical protein
LSLMLICENFLYEFIQKHDHCFYLSNKQTNKQQIVQLSIEIKENK